MHALYAFMNQEANPHQSIFVTLYQMSAQMFLFSYSIYINTSNKIATIDLVAKKSIVIWKFNVVAVTYVSHGYSIFIFKPKSSLDSTPKMHSVIVLNFQFGSPACCPAIVYSQLTNYRVIGSYNK